MARFIHSNMAGAPALGTAAGAGLAVVDAVLRTGFNIKTPSSVTVAAGVATFAFLASHGYEDKVWIRVAGSTAGALNTDLQCTVPNSTSFTVAAPGVPDGPVGGTIETRVAPLGWEMPFSGTNVAVYRSPNLTGTRLFFQVDDRNLSSASYIHFRGYESMTSAVAGTNPFPPLALYADSTPATSAWKSTGSAWCVAGDDRTVYLRTVQSGDSFGVMSFGDFESLKPADAFAAFVGSSYNGYVVALSVMNGNLSRYLARDASGLILSPPVGIVGPGSQTSGGGSRAYPGAVNGGVTLVRHPLILDGTSSSSPIRGVMRGLMFVAENIPAIPWSIVPAVPGVTGRVLIVRDNSNQGAVAFPIDEAW